MKNTFLIIASIVVFASCEREAEWPDDQGILPEIVVEAMLTNEVKQHEVILSFPMSSANETPVMISDADVRVSDGNTVFHFSEDTLNRGHYYSDSAFAGTPGQTYRLLLRSVQGQMWYGYDYMPPAEIFTPLSIALTNTHDSLYKISYVCQNYDPSKFAMYEISLDWSAVPGYDSSINKAKLYYYTLGTLDMGEILQTDFESVTFPKGTLIKERRYSISPLYAAWLREILIETQWNNGIVVSQPGNATSNMVNELDTNHRALGFFSACSVVEWNGTAQ
ncbi:hypothetical protein SDC9_39312 [bioreactor metagenome]|uniref:DUF4249 domain-containing protein n=1 Tax=bioreactor metagenome TaxID=1076179 RepID=A0A644VPA5_9ZZZZ